MNFCSRQAKFSIGAVAPTRPAPFTTPPPPLSIHAKHSEVPRNLAGTRVNRRGWEADPGELLLDRPEPRLEIHVLATLGLVRRLQRRN